jgi:hypothetical protein
LRTIEKKILRLATYLGLKVVDFELKMSKDLSWLHYEDFLKRKTYFLMLRDVYMKEGALTANAISKTFIYSIRFYFRKRWNRYFLNDSVIIWRQSSSTIERAF